jgi:hypothetical protein
MVLFLTVHLINLDISQMNHLSFYTELIFINRALMFKTQTSPI